MENTRELPAAATPEKIPDQQQATAEILLETYSRISLQMLRFNKVESDKIHFWLYLHSYLTILDYEMAGSKCPSSNRRGQRSMNSPISCRY
jgi:hypothetical protein